MVNLRPSGLDHIMHFVELRKTAEILRCGINFVHQSTTGMGHTITNSYDAVVLAVAHDAFRDFQYPNDIGPGVYDIHSPNEPDVGWMVQLMEKAAERLPKERLWVNPDCGLKTRKWEETQGALANMVDAAKQLREAG